MRHLVIVSAAAIIVAGCGAKPTGAVVPRAAAHVVAPASPGMLVHLQSGAGITTIAAKGGRWTAPNAVAAPDWSTVFSVEGNELRSLDGVTGVVRASQVVRPGMRPVVSSADGSFVALTDTPVRVGQGVLPAGRIHSTVVVAHANPASGRVRTIELDGNIVPEGFSSDGSLLFVIEFLPAMHPDRYRVRSLEVATGQIGPVFTFDKVVDNEVMQGLSRTQVFSATGSQYGPMLYTLYSRAGGPTGYGEVHALSLNGFVHCTDLPASLKVGPAGGAIAVSPDGQRVFVANEEGAVAEIDASGSSQQLFPIVRVAQLVPGPGTRTVALTADNHTVWVALGTHVVGLDAATLRPVTTTTVGQPVQALAVTSRQALYAATSSAVEVIDPITGAATSVTSIETAPTRLAVA